MGFILPEITLGGAERWLESLVRHLPSASRGRLAIAGVAIGNARPTVPAPYLEGAIRRHATIFTGSTAVEQLAGQADVLVASNVKSLDGVPQAFAGPIASVCHGHCTWSVNLLRGCLGRATHWAAVSRDAARSFPDPAKAQILHSGIEPDRCRTLRARREETRRAWGLAAGELAVGYVGRLSPEKRPLDVVRAVRALGQPFRAVLVGDGWDAQKTLAEARRLLPHVIHVPAVDQVGDVLGALDCLLLTSASEGFGLVLAEAWYAGLPTVSTPVGVVPELLAEGLDLTTVAVGATPGEMAGAIRHALHHDHQATVGRAATVVRERFTAPSMAQRWADWLLAICDPPPQPAIRPASTKRNPIALSIVLFDDVEKPTSYLRHYLEAMERGNRPAFCETRIALVTQRAEGVQEVRDMVTRCRLPITLYSNIHEHVGGYPIWDVSAALKRLWPHLPGDYVSVEHTEFCWLPCRLQRTIDALRSERPWIALGNLRRVGSHSKALRVARCDKELAAKFAAALDRDWEQAMAMAETMPTTWWCAWYAQESVPGWQWWLEDQCFVRKTWLEATHFLDHCDRQVFQDVYDLLHFQNKVLGARQLAPRSLRLPFEVQKSIHLDHPRAWRSWTPAIRDWFLAQPDRWQGTRYADRAAWDALLAAARADGGQPRDSLQLDDAVFHLRCDAGGTVARFAARCQDWLEQGGAEELAAFYHSHGTDREENP